MCIVQIKGKSGPSFRGKVLLPQPYAFKIVLTLGAKRPHATYTSNARHAYCKNTSFTSFTRHKRFKETSNTRHFSVWMEMMGLMRSGGSETHVLVSENTHSQNPGWRYSERTEELLYSVQKYTISMHKTCTA